MKSPVFQRKASRLQKDSSGITSLKLQELHLAKKQKRAMNNKVVYNVSLSAKQLSDFSGKSINTCKKFLRDLTTNLTTNLTAESDTSKSVEANIVTADLTPNLTTYTPTPVEPTVYPDSPKQKFDFAQMASQSLQDNKTESKSDYWRRFRASLGDVD